MDKRDSFIVTFIYVRLNYEKYILKSVLENCNLSSIKLTKITYKKTSIHQTQFKFFFFISIVICLCHCESSKNFPTCKKQKIHSILHTHADNLKPSMLCVQERESLMTCQCEIKAKKLCLSAFLSHFLFSLSPLRKSSIY